MESRLAEIEADNLLKLLLMHQHSLISAQAGMPKQRAQDVVAFIEQLRLELIQAVQKRG